MHSGQLRIVTCKKLFVFKSLFVPIHRLCITEVGRAFVDFDITIVVGRIWSRHAIKAQKRNQNTNTNPNANTQQKIYLFRYIRDIIIQINRFDVFVPFQCSLCFCVTNKSFVHFFALGHLIYLIFPVKKLEFVCINNLATNSVSRTIRKTIERE